MPDINSEQYKQWARLLEKELKREMKNPLSARMLEEGVSVPRLGLPGTAGSPNVVVSDYHGPRLEFQKAELLLPTADLPASWRVELALRALESAGFEKRSRLYLGLGTHLMENLACIEVCRSLADKRRAAGQSVPELWVYLCPEELGSFDVEMNALRQFQVSTSALLGRVDGVLAWQHSCDQRVSDQLVENMAKILIEESPLGEQLRRHGPQDSFALKSLSADLLKKVESRKDQQLTSEFVRARFDRLVSGEEKRLGVNVYYQADLCQTCAQSFIKKSAIGSFEAMIRKWRREKKNFAPQQSFWDPLLDQHGLLGDSSGEDPALESKLYAEENL